ncbi:hypothetical protein ABT354_33175 [Streptomyces sp. NPDC000594]|uniref:hypothetical protein n=1 Tax=Streptomyces sp. NPDC000594 TaxID=3154261 RepID=UPI003329E314
MSGTRPRAGSMKGAALALAGSLALLPALAGCGLLEEEEVKRHTLACGVVLDGSGSGGKDRKGFDADAKLKDSLDRFLTDTGCGTLSFGPITRASRSSKCQANQMELDPDLPASQDREHFRGRLREDAMREAKKMLACAKGDRPGSDVLGALDRITIHRPDDGKGSYAVLVVSDFQQRDDEFRIDDEDLTTEKKRDAAAGRLLDSHGTPRLKGMDVYPVGYGMKYGADPSSYRHFDAFWTALLEGRLGADVHTTYR